MGDRGRQIDFRHSRAKRSMKSRAGVFLCGLVSVLPLVLVANCGSTSRSSNDPPNGSGGGGSLAQGATETAATTTETASGPASTNSVTSSSTTGGEPDSSSAGAGNLEPDASVEPADAGTQPDAEPDADAGTPVDTDPAVPSEGCSASTLPAYVSFSTGTARLSHPLYSEADAPAPLVIGFHATNNGSILAIIDADGPFIDEYVIALPEAPIDGLGTWEVESKDVLEEIYDALQTEVCFDTRRVYAVGHASGGRYLQTALCDGSADFKPSELFRAVAFQGAMEDRRCTSSKLFPTLFIRSVHDTVASQLGDEPDNSGALQVLVEANGCETPGTPSTGSCSSTYFECVDYDGCSEPFRACIHDKALYGSDEWPCFATEEIYEFLEGLR